ncbi:MAG TPA: hypothetical protein VKH19_14415 [Gemmatimonadaceae bacterium]|nr:hypothetical protein [Gemmatimonadaceae bacterium]
MLRCLWYASFAFVFASAAWAQALSVADSGRCASASPDGRDSTRARSDSATDSMRTTMVPRPSVAAPADHATIVLFASASAREVRFQSQPRIVVRLCGAVTDSVHVVERRNLPERVQAGVTYRDVYIAVEIMGHLNADCLARRIGVAGGPGASTGDANCAFVTVNDSAAARRPPP